MNIAQGLFLNGKTKERHEADCVPVPIDCTLHDHLEIASLFHYQVRVRLRDGSEIAGEAVTTRTLADKSELFVVAREGKRVQIPMHELVHLQVLTPGARFGSIAFPGRDKP